LAEIFKRLLSAKTFARTLLGFVSLVIPTPRSRIRLQDNRFRLPNERQATRLPTKEANWADESFRHCDGIDLKERFAGNFCGARDSSWSLFVSFLGFDFGVGRFLLHGR